MPAPRVLSVALLDPVADPASGESLVRVTMESGRESVFVAATFDLPEKWMQAGRLDHWFAEPVLYVRTLDAQTVRAAAEAMAAELGGYWLRYYRAAPGAPSKIGLGAATADKIEDGCGVVEAVLKDGREFSILSATPSWWRGEAARRALRFYYGPMVLFVRKLDAAHAKRAARRMAAVDEQLFCRYDTPRRTLPEILDAFAAAHPPA